MKKFGLFWMGFLIILAAGNLSCSGRTNLVRPRPDERVPRTATAPSETKTADRSGLPESPGKKSPASPGIPAPPSPASPETPPVERPMPPAPVPSTAPSLPPVPGPSTAPVRPVPVTPRVQRDGGVVFNFDNADIYEVIRVMADVLKINYLIDPKVKGVVNIHTSGQVSADDIFSIFQSVLKLSGATAIKRDRFYEIVPLADAKRLYVTPTTTGDGAKTPPEERYTIQIVPLSYIAVSELSKIIKPFLSDGAEFIEHPSRNILIIGDMGLNVSKALDMIRLFDTDIFADLRVRIYPVFNADVKEIATEMERIFTSFEVSTKSGRGVGITFTPIARINSLLVVSSIPQVFDKVESWLRELDRTPAEGTKLNVFVYYVQNAKAKDLADVLKEVFVSAKEKKVTPPKETTPAPKPGTKQTPPTQPSPPTPPQTTAPAREEEGVPEGDINIVVDEATNSLIIKAFERDYKRILETVRKLDIYPKQVLIELLLVDVSLNKDTQFGVDFVNFIDSLKAGQYQQTYNIGGSSGFGSNVTGISPGPGLTYSIVEQAGRFAAQIRAAAAEGRLKVITSPHLLASNNKEAKIQIGTSEPILTTTYATSAQTVSGTNVLEGTIEYKDIGTILTVIPRISDGGLVTLEITIEESSLATRTLGVANSLSVPAFNKTTAKTVLSITEGQSIAIGGLIRDSKDYVERGVPVLNKIPIVGWLFGSRFRASDKRELILLLTPRIITDQAQSRAVTEDFKRKLRGIVRELEMKELK